MKIGVVLAGGMSKGMYEIGCLNAIAEYFGKESIRCISASSIGSLIGYAFASNQMPALIKEMQSVDIQKSGKFFPSMSGNMELNAKIRNIVLDDNTDITPLYITVWNFTKNQVEYIPFQELTKKEGQNYLCAAIAIPIFNKGIRLNDCTFFDGAFLDNIPVFPLLKEDLDYIFCIYFDTQNYLFENDIFNEKIIKLYQFPTKQPWSSFTFDPTRFDSMIEYGYKYTDTVIKSIFSEQQHDKIHCRICELNNTSFMQIKRRLTCDVILTNTNKMMKRLAKRKIR